MLRIIIVALKRENRLLLDWNDARIDARPAEAHVHGCIVLLPDFIVDLLFRCLERLDLIDVVGLAVALVVVAADVEQVVAVGDAYWAMSTAWKKTSI